MQIEVELAGLRRTAATLGEVGQDVDALGSATLPALGATAAAAGSPVLADAVHGLLDGVHAAVQGAVVSLTELGRAVEAAARDYGAQEAAVAGTLRPGLRP